MALTANQLRKQVDLPVWEWLRFAPAVPATGISCSCTADNSLFNENNGRYIYYLLNTTNFWRYDTIADTYEQLASPPNIPVASGTSMRFAGAQGYYNRVISATSTTIVTGMPYGGSAVGYKIRIVSGRGAGQERIITAVSDPTVADYGAATAGATTSLTDTAKTWTSGYTSATININNWVGYVVRTLFGTGAGQVRKILYNSTTVLTTGDVNFVQNDPFANNTMVAPAAGTVYQIESSTITVDTAWDTTPDNTSRFVIQSGGIWLQSSAAAAPFYTLQYYDVLHDMWYAKPALTNMIAGSPTDSSLERVTENSTIWVQGTASTGGSTTTLVDTTANWTTNQWVGYELYLYSGTGLGQIVAITSNTNNTLTFSAITTAPDTTTRYQILGYDGGKSSAYNTYNTFVDSTKSWTTNRWTNHSVRILYGAGAGQLRPVLSNTATTLTLYTPWTVIPDSTSVYIIQGNSDSMYLTWGGNAEVFVHNASNLDLLSHGRLYESGIACVGAALLSDSAHRIYEQMPIAIASMTGTTTITATTAQAHNLQRNQYVSIRGVTTATTDQFNVTGLYQVATVPTTTTFTYVPAAAGSGTYGLLTALSTSNLSDASKDFRDNVASANTTSLTFTRTTPSNINGWYVTGNNIIAGTTISNGAGTTTLTLSATMNTTPNGVMIMTPWGPTSANVSTFSSGGGAGVANIVLTAATNPNINGWYAVGTGLANVATVNSGAGTTTLNMSSACTGTVSGNITFYPPTVTGRQVVMSTTAPTITTGATTGQLMMANGSGVNGATIQFLAALGAAPVAALTRYAITSPALLGAALEGTTTTYNSGVATGGSATTLVDSSAFWATATGTGSAQGTTITLSAAAPGNINGWYVSGTGINAGAYILSGAGTTTLTVSVAHSGAVSGTISCQAWNQSLVGRRIKIQSGVTGLNQELVITVVAPTTGTLTFGSAVAPVNNVAVYSLLSVPVKGAGHITQWVGGNSVTTTRGRYLIMTRGGASAGFDRLDFNTDRVSILYTTPYTETLTTGSMYAYDGADRLYFTKDITQRVYYLDLNTNFIHGAGVFPYTAGSSGLGNRMEVFTTTDGLKYLWINRQLQQEHFRQLLFW